MIVRLIRNLFLSKEAKRHKLVGNPKYWKLKQNFQINFLKEMGLKNDDKLLDIGCGTLRGGVPIIQFLNDSCYYGLEVRKDVLDEGIKEAEEQGLMDKKPNLIHFQDFNDLKIDESFDVVFAFSVLIHMTDEIIESCFAFVSSCLSEKGVFYANVNLDQNKKGDWQGFPVMHKPPSFYADLANKYGMKLEDIGSLKDFGHETGDPPQDNQRMLAISKL